MIITAEKRLFLVMFSFSFSLFFFPYSLCLTITRILGEFIASGLKLIISARQPKYKRNYVMVFYPGPHRYNDLQRKNKEETLWLGLFIYVDLEDKNARQAYS